MRLSEKDPAIIAAIKKGLIPQPIKSSRKHTQLIEATFRASLDRPVWEVPVATSSECNLRDWRRRSKRSDSAWRAVSRAFGPHLVYVATFARLYHTGHPIHVRLTRLGGRKLDQSVNLPASLKAVEDAVAWSMGADDGSPLWRCTFDQDPGGSMGVRIELLKS